MKSMENVDEVLPLAPMQEGLLFESESAPRGDDVYTVQHTIRIQGDLDPDCLRDCCSALVQRHSVLRSAFIRLDSGSAVQVVNKAIQVPWSEEDLTTVAEAQRQAAARHLADAEHAKGFDLGAAPLIKFLLLKLGAREWHLVVTTHHIILDGWSTTLLFQQLAALYKADEGGKSAVGATPYSTFLAWLQRQDHDLSRQLWQEELEGYVRPSQLRLRTGDAAAQEQACHLKLKLPASLTRDVAQAARVCGVTQSNLIEACWALTLGKGQGNGDVVFGAIASGRSPELRDVESIVGLLVTSYPVRFKISAKQSFRALLEDRQKTQARLDEHTYLGLAEIQNTVGGGALFDSIVVYENYPAAARASDAGDISFHHDVELSRDGTHYPLTLVVAPGDEMYVRLDYMPSRYSRSQADTLLQRFRLVLEIFTRDADAPVGSHDLLLESERAYLESVNPGYPSTRDDQPMAPLDLFRKAANRFPTVPAVVDSSGAELSYEELDINSTALAESLAHRNVGPGTTVAICLSRSNAFVVAVIATLKTGASFLAVDPEYPVARVQFMLDSSRPVVTIVDRETAPSLDSVRSGSVITVGVSGTESEHPVPDGNLRPGVKVAPEAPMYLVYTSGSTGTPKPIGMPGTAMVQLLRWHHGVIGGGVGTRVAQFTSFSFDVSVQEIFSALFFGKTLIIPDDDTRRDPLLLAYWMQSQRIDELFAPSTVVSALCEEAVDNEIALGDLKAVVQAGEALTVTSSVRTFFERYTQARFYNHYGPAETHVVCGYTLPREVGSWPKEVPIGRPTANSRLYVLDHTLQLCPPGVSGELYIAGDALAFGYQGMPGKTSERFVASPFGRLGERMYRTGDICCWDENGDLAFIGRSDDQIKIRGYRIEPGEVENAIRNSPDVADVAVVSRGDGAQRHLVAYVVPIAASSAGERELRSFLLTALPAYMIPSRFVMISRLPRTQTGKIDRRALDAAESRAPIEARDSGSPYEQILATLFAEVLGRERVWANENFFALGGHSLTATRLVSRIRATLEADVSLKDLFERPSPFLLAASIDPSAAARPRPVMGQREALSPLSFAQKRLWFLQGLEGPSATYNIPIVLRMSGNLVPGILEQALRDLVGRHEVLRTVFPEFEGVPYQEVIPVGDAAISLNVSSIATPDELAEALLRTAQETFDLRSEIPIRAHLFVLSESEYALQIVIHHIAGDGWSLRTIAEDLTESYDARQRGNEPAFRPLKLQYRDYAVWQRDMLGEVSDPTSIAAMQVRYWKEQLRDLPEYAPLMANADRPDESSYQGDYVEFEIGAALHARLDAIARGTGSTMFMVLHAALAAMISRFSTHDDVVIGSPIAGRTDQLLEDLVGFFVNTLALRTSAKGAVSFEDLIRNVRKSALEAYAHQDIPFEYLVEALNPERSLNKHPIFQVMLAVQNAPSAEFALPGLSVEATPGRTHTSKFDLFFSVVEERDGAGRPLGMKGALEFSTDLYSQARAEEILGRWLALLESASNEPDVPLAHFDVATDSEIDLISSWNATEAEFCSRPMVDQILDQCLATPERTALSDGTAAVSYRELRDRVARLARVLTARGVRRGDLVAVSLPRTADLPIVLLAVLHAGAAYVPVDPNHPSTRTDLILEQAKPSLLVCDSETASKFTDQPRAVRLDDPSFAKQLSDCSAELLDVRARPSDLAYVMFTSGTTGRPKGVAIEHQSLSNFLSSMQSLLALNDQAVLMSLTTVSFDIAALELFLPLSVGACVVIADDETARDPRRAAALAREANVSMVQATPSHWRMLVGEYQESFANVVALTGGEALPARLAALLTDSCERVFNLYGPTETTIWSTYSAVRAGQPVNIGRGIANTRLHVLDRYLRPAPIGTTGELYISGGGLARGYWKDPGQTSSRFVCDPFSSAPERMYRTGDLARWDEAGNLHFEGRVDSQVKVRGHRIELAEVEVILERHPDVKHSVVEVRPDGSGSSQIVAYYVPAVSQRVSEDGDRETQVHEWGEIYDEIYRASQEAALGEDFASWVSSYDGNPIPVEQMGVWRDETIDKIRELRPRRVLEIGVGTGLLLGTLANEVDEYWATDVSEVAIEKLRHKMSEGLVEPDTVRLCVLPAHDFGSFPVAYFDTIIINSVVQYFPDAEYLDRVLRTAIGHLAPGGAIFVGDVRNYRLHREFLAGVQAARFGEDQVRIRSAVERAESLEKELLVAPEHFHALVADAEGLAGVSIELKRSNVDNELSAYRYDVILYGQGRASRTDVPNEVVVSVAGLSRTAMRRRLLATDRSRVRLIEVPNERLVSDRAVLSALDDNAEAPLSELPLDQAVLGDIESAATELGLVTWVTWAPHDYYCVEVLLLQPGEADSANSRPEPPIGLYRGGDGVSPTTNTPLVAAPPVDQVTTVREFTRENLPEYMVPSFFVPLDALPLSANGKLDRKALPAPQSLVSPTGRAPRTPQEQIVSELFAEILSMPSVGTDEDFFDLGGHSLLATQLVARIRSTFGVEVSLRSLFESATPAAVAASLRAGSISRAPLVPQERPDRPPLSYAQSRLWFIHQMDADSGAYNIPLAFRLTGELNLEALRQALNDLVARHESLRTVFPDEDGSPYQLVLPLDRMGPVLTIHQVGENDISHAVTDASQRDFDLVNDAPIRADLFQLSDHQHVLLVVVHHIAADGWSLRPLANDLATAYQNRVLGEEPFATPLPVQYVDFTLWQRQLLGSGSDPSSMFHKQLEYWSSQLVDTPVDHGVITDYPRPEVASYAGDYVSLDIPVSLHERLLSFARSTNSTLFMVLQAGLSGFLSRMSGKSDIVTGSPIAGRTDENLDDLIGFFVNTIVMRINVSEDLTFNELTQRTRGVSLSGFANQDVPFEYLVEKISPPRSLGRHPFFGTMFALQNAPQGRFVLPGLQVDTEPGRTGTSKFDLFFSLLEERTESGAPAGIKAVVEYATDLYEEATVRLLVERWLSFLEAAVEEPDTPIIRVPVSEGSTSRQQEELVEWHSSKFGSQDSLASRLSEVFREYADSPAITDGTSKLTFAELETRVSEIETLLRSNGIGVGANVGILMDRGIEYVATVIATVRQGAAYVPLDVRHPAIRQRFILQDCSVDLLVVANSGVVADVTRELYDLPVADVSEKIREHARARPDDSGLHEELPAYIMYTSGTTGTPKGVVVPRRSVVDLTRDECWQSDKHARVLLHSSIAFDAATFELWVPLLNGDCIVVAPPGDFDPRALARVIRSHDVSSLWLTSSAFDIMVDFHPDCFEAVREVWTGGEPVSASSVRQIVQMWPELRVVDGYGPTEATTFATRFPIGSADLQRLGADVPIGYTLDGTFALILDEALQPVPDGFIGELYLVGDSLAHGYLNRPSLTAERFVAVPWGVPGLRMYRTGDLVRRNFRREIEMFGRVDEQVKIRGFRVETDEVAAVLEEHPAVARAVVVPRSLSSDKQLLAYVVPASQATSERVDAASHVEEWRSLYDRLYADSKHAEIGQDFVGWHSSYDDQPIPEEEMLQWRDETVARLSTLGAKRILEIGVGTGLLLHEMVDEAVEYVGTDISETIIRTLNEQLRARPDVAEKVTLYAKPADDLSGLPAEHFDLVILNSVVQYFPSIDYLSEVVEGLTRLLTPGGAIFIGDVRNLRLLPAFAAGVQAVRVGTEDQDRLTASVRQAIRLERELLIDPEYFYALPEQFPQISGAVVSLKRSSISNELFNYRFDALIRVQAGDEYTVTSEKVLSWSELGNLDGLEEVVAEATRGSVRLTNVPHAGIARDVNLLSELGLADGMLTEYRRGQTPDVFYSLGARLGYTANVEPGPGPANCFDVVFTKEPTSLLRGGARNDHQNDLRLANTPIETDAANAVLTSVDRYARERLPEFMVPTMYSVIEYLPLTANGKIDKKALPQAQPAIARTPLRPPATPAEQVLCEIFAEVLELPTVTPQDDFFELGGHSLLAARLIPRIRESLGLEVSLHNLFEAPTPEGLMMMGSDRARPDASFEVVLPLRSAAGQAPLFCIHPGGGLSWSYINLVRHLSPGIPLYAIQARGLSDTDSPLPITMTEMVMDYADRLEEAWPVGPVRLLGWSFGGLAAHALAVELQARGRVVSSLVALDVKPGWQDLEHEDVAGVDAGALETHLRYLLSLANIESLAPIDQELSFEDAMGILKHHGSVLGTLERERLEAVVRISANNTHLMIDHTFDVFDGDITVIATSDQADPMDTAEGWRPYVSGEVHLYTVPGTHGTLLAREGSVSRIAEILNVSLGDEDG